MQRLYRKRIIVGVGGGIAAYKSAELIRRLKDQDADVRVVMTKGGREFITPLTLQALSGHPVHLDLLDPEAEAAMGHIELARWADLVLIAPATADLMARLAQGVADDLLTTLVPSHVARPGHPGQRCTADGARPVSVWPCSR
jgi:phosphopantothenoylcysteine decarboxylase/phosphopantothenate--cysteine ligase